MNMTKLIGEKLELAFEQLDHVTGGTDLISAFLSGFDKGCNEKPTPAPAPSGGGGGNVLYWGAGGPVGIGVGFIK
jgi:hypothetical protein